MGQHGEDVHVRLLLDEEKLAHLDFILLFCAERARMEAKRVQNANTPALIRKSFSPESAHSIILGRRPERGRGGQVHYRVELERGRGRQHAIATPLLAMSMRGYHRFQPFTAARVGRKDGAWSAAPGLWLAAFAFFAIQMARLMSFDAARALPPQYDRVSIAFRGVYANVYARPPRSARPRRPALTSA